MFVWYFRKNSPKSTASNAAFSRPGKPGIPKVRASVIVASIVFPSAVYILLSGIFFFYLTFVIERRAHTWKKYYDNKKKKYLILQQRCLSTICYDNRAVDANYSNNNIIRTRNSRHLCNAFVIIVIIIIAFKPWKSHCCSQSVYITVVVIIFTVRKSLGIIFRIFTGQINNCLCKYSISNDDHSVRKPRFLDSYHTVTEQTFIDLCSLSFFFCIVGNLEMARWTTTSWCKEAASPYCPAWKPVFWWVNLHFRLFYPGPPTLYPSTINQFKHKIILMYCVSLLPHILIITIIYYILLYIKLLLLYYIHYTHRTANVHAQGHIILIAAWDFRMSKEREIK